MGKTSRLELNVERDSVCAGDDIDAPHTKSFAFQANTTIAEALSEIIGTGYLVKIAGGKATWIVETDKPFAVVAQHWQSPKFLIDPGTPLTACVRPGLPNALFFRYWCQVAPEVVFDCLRMGRPLPDMYGRNAV